MRVALCLRFVAIVRRFGGKIENLIGKCYAQVAELVDAPASGAGYRKVVEVQVLFWAPIRFFSAV